MGRDSSQETHLTPAVIQAYLREHGYPDAAIEHLTPLGQRTQEGLKSYGYGRPLRATFRAGGNRHDVVVRTMSPDPFGHDRRSDRAQVLLLAFDTFERIPQHIRALDVGAFDVAGSMRSMARGELFLLTDYVEGELYAADLHAIQAQDAPAPRDRERAVALARYLATLHA
ncbi:MAG TPA: hypothetical protein VFH51_02295, partial [Myxococcota bacterium]|nr:hypothetical protein [Myxococcota bacterium]